MVLLTQNSIHCLCMWYSPKWRLIVEKRYFLFSLCTKIIIVDDPCCLWEGQRALWIQQKYLNLGSEDERRSCRFGTTWGWVINGQMFFFGWTIPLSVVKCPAHFWTTLHMSLPFSLSFCHPHCFLFSSFFLLRPGKFHKLLHWSAHSASTNCPPRPLGFTAITCVCMCGNSEVAHQGSGRPFPYPMSLEQLQNAGQLNVGWDMIDPRHLIIPISMLHNSTW